MTTSRRPFDYYETDELVYKNNTPRMIPQRNYSYPVSNHEGVITSKTRDGTYNVVEKDFGDHKVIYHIPIEYGDDYDVSQLEDISITDEQTSRNSPKLVRRRIIEQYNDYDYDNDIEYVEEVPVLTPRRRVYDSSRRPRDVQVIERIYEPIPPVETVEYIYEDDYGDRYERRPDNHEEVEYIVQERVPKQVVRSYRLEHFYLNSNVFFLFQFVEEPRPTRRAVYLQEPSVPVPSPRPPPPPISYSPRRSSPYHPSPRPPVNPRTPSPIPTKPIRRNNISLTPPQLPRKQRTPRSPIYEPPVKPNIPKTNEPPLRLMDVIAQNRARRGPNIPKPRREIDEAKVYDPPTYKRNIIKNGFIIHK
jgi:hypothetical protein